MQYVTYDAQGALTGAYWQSLLPEHQGHSIAVTPEQYAGWTGYRANAARDGLEIAPPAPVPPPALPSSVTQRQARLALLQAGKLADVQAAIAALPGTHGDAARIEWEYASTIERASPLVAAMGASLQWDAAALDSLFQTAAEL
jgi:hypothetical protein